MVIITALCLLNTDMTAEKYVLHAEEGPDYNLVLTDLRYLSSSLSKRGTKGKITATFSSGE